MTYVHVPTNAKLQQRVVTEQKKQFTEVVTLKGNNFLKL